MKNVVASVRLCLGALLLLLVARPAALGQAPAWNLAISANGSAAGWAAVQATAADSSGNIYVAGAFSGTISIGSTFLTSAGGSDVYVAKWSTLTNSFVWAQRAGTTDDDAVTAVAVSGTRVYVAGTFHYTGATFSGSSLLSPGIGPGVRDAFVVKFTDAGAFVWAQRAGGPTDVRVRALVVSGTNVYIGGSFNDQTMSFGAITLTNPPAGLAFPYENGYVVKLADAGSTGSFVWAKLVGGDGSKFVRALAVAGNHVYLTGIFAPMPGITAPCTAQFGNLRVVHSPVRTADAFIARLTDAGGSASFDWAQLAGSAGNILAYNVAVSGTNVYIAGTFGVGQGTNLTALFDTTALTPVGEVDLFLLKLLDTGTAAQQAWVRPVGGSYTELINNIVVNGSDVYMAGMFGSSSLSFDGTVLVNSNPVGDISDAFVAKFVDAGSSGSFAWAKQAGTIGYDGAVTLCLSGAAVYVGGYTSTNASFDTLRFNSFGSSAADGFLAAINATVYPPRLMTFSPASGSASTTVTLTGTDFTNAAGVSFNGTPAPGFIVNATGTVLTVAVPAGASSGLLRVSTPGGTAISSTPFTVQAGLGTAAAQAAPLHLSPNPAHHTATVALPAFAPTEARALTLRDALGRAVRRFAPGPAPAGTPYSMDLTGLAPGLYLLQAGAARARLVVE